MSCPNGTSGRATRSVSLLLPGALIAPALIAAAAVATAVARPVMAPAAAASKPGKTLPSVASLPLAFQKNEGQTDPQVKYLARGSGYSLFLTSNEAVMRLRRPEPARKRSFPGRIGSQIRRKSAGSDVVRLRLAGANPNATVGGEAGTPTRVSYLRGKSSADWQQDVSTYQRVRYDEVYPGVDLVYYGAARQLEYDFLVSPQADPSAIRLQVNGAKARVTANGDLELKAEGGALQMQRPVTYQEEGGRRQLVDSRYIVHPDGEIGFELGSYDRTRSLVIDPILLYANYLGGTEWDSGIASAFDGAGNVYVGGYTESSDFPTAAAGQTGFGGDADAFVAKFSANGTQLVYSTYLGGSGLDAVLGIAVDAQGGALVTGVTDSTNFPLQSAARNTPGGGEDAFFARLTPAGNAFTYSSYLGGTGNERGTRITVDGGGNAYFGGWTESDNFPVTANPLQAGRAGDYDAFVTSATPAGALRFSTYLGGRDGDDIAGIAVSPFDGTLWLSGHTDSGDLLNQRFSNSVWQPTFNGGRFGDAFLVQIAAATGLYLNGTYYGGTGSDNACGVAVDRAGYVYLAGTTDSPDAVLTSNPRVLPFQDQPRAGTTDVYVAKFDGDLGLPVYLSYITGEGDEIARGMGIDDDVDLARPLLGPSSLYIFGDTDSVDYPQVRAAQDGLVGHADLFVTRVRENMYLAEPIVSVEYSTLIGGTGDDIGGDMAVNAVGDLALTGTTSSGNFPVHRVLTGRTARRGPADAFVMKWLDGDGAPGGSARVTTVPPFGAVKANTKTEKALTVRNANRNSWLAVKVIPPTGAANRFRVPSGVLAVWLAPGDTYRLPVRFNPTAVGNYASRMTVLTSDPSRARVSIELTGSVKPPRPTPPPPPPGGGGTTP